MALDGTMDGKEWLQHTEEEFIFNEALVNQKFNDVSEAQVEDDGKVSYGAKKRLERSKEEQDLAYRFVGIIDVDQSEFFKKAVQQWTKELATLCTDASSCFENVMKKRLVVQKYLHVAQLADKQKRKRQKKRKMAVDEDEKAVPVVVRLGVLTMFPLIEALGQLKDVNFQRLCSSTLDTVLSVISTLPTLGLHNEPADCVDSFKNFIFNLIKDNNFTIDTPEKAQAVVALIGLAISRGNAQHMLQAIDVLFQIAKSTDDAMSDKAEPLLMVGQYLRQLAEYHKDSDSPLLVERDGDPFHVETRALSKKQLGKSAAHAETRAGAIASDGTFLYIHTEDGLQKVGTGLNGTIKGHVYKSNTEYQSAASKSSLVHVGGKLYFWSPDVVITEEAENPSPKFSKNALVVLNPDTFEEERRVALPQSVVSHVVAVITDGRYIHVLGRREGASPSLASSFAPPARQALSVDAEPSDEMAVEEEQVDLSESSDSDEDMEENDDEDNEDEDGGSEDEGGDDTGEDAPVNPMELLLRNGRSISVNEESLSRVLQHLNPSEIPPQFDGLAGVARLSASGSAADVKKDEEDTSSGSQFVVETYDSSRTSSWVPIRTVDLAGPPATLAPSDDSSDAGSSVSSTPEPAIMTGHADKAVFYTNGHHLVALLPPPNAARKGVHVYNLTKSRVFNLADGKFVSEHSLQAEPGASVACFDSSNNNIWSYVLGTRAVSRWLNFGIKVDIVANDDAMDVVGAKPTMFRPYTPESILTRPELAPAPKAKKGKLGSKDSVRSVDTISFLVAHMDRLARQHPFYNKSTIIDETETLPEEYTRHHFCAEPSKEVFQYILSILQRATEALQSGSSSKRETMAYVIIAVLRLLKINMYEVIATEKRLSSLHKDDKDRKSIGLLRDRLLAFIECPPAQQELAEAAKIIRRESMEALTLGFNLFYPVPTQQVAFLSERFAAAATSPVAREHLELLLSELAEWYRVADILGDDPRDDQDKKKKEDGTKGRATLTPSQAPINKSASKLLASLIHFAVAETNSFVQAIQKNDQSVINKLATSPIFVSPALRVLLSLQRDLLNLTFSRPVLTDYTTQLVEQSSSLLSLVSASSKDFLNDPTSTRFAALDNALQRSILRIVLPGFITGLGRKNHRDIAFATAAVEQLLKLISHLDALNKAIPAAAAADMSYVNRLSDKKERKYVVETKHPYATGKNQFKETVTVPNAEAIALRFDPKSRTGSSSSDVLQLFMSTGLENPVMRDGTPVFFSGNNWPKQAVVVPGNTITFVFTSNSRPDSSSTMASIAARWGFRCVITEHVIEEKDTSAVVPHWLLDLETSLATLAAKLSAALIEGDAVSEKEKQCQPWLDTKLIGGGFDEANPTTDNRLKYLESFAEGRDGADTLYEWIKAQSARPMLRPATKPFIERVERFVLAAILKHMGLIDAAHDFSIMLAEGKELPGDWIARFKYLGTQVFRVTTLIQRRGEMQKEWQIAVEDRSKDTEIFDNYQSDPQRLMELCEMRGVEFDLVDTNETVKRLFQKLQEEIAALDKQVKENPDKKIELPNPFETICNPVIERAKFLLRMMPATRAIQSPSAEAPNPFASQQQQRESSPAPAARLRASITMPSLSEGQSAHPLSKSLSHFPNPKADSKKQLEDPSEDSFTQRVSDLRRWLNTYQSYKSWQDSALPVSRSHDQLDEAPRTPLQGVVSFVSSSVVSVRELERIVRLHISRAKGRVAGMNHLAQLLNTVSFAVTRQQAIGSIGRPLREGGHYLDAISACGELLAQTVSESFGKLFELLTSLVSNNDVDPTSRLLALNLCGLSFAPSDVGLLQKSRIFPLLQKLVSDRPVPPALPFAAPIEAKKEDEEDDEEEAAKKREAAEQERERVEFERRALENTYIRNVALRTAAWTSFRLLATQCFNWSRSEEPYDKTAVSQIQEQVFDLMCGELKRLSQGLSKHDPAAPARESADLESEQCFQLLSLLYLLGEPRALARKDNVTDLLSILGTNSAPRSQRLVLRLCRRIIPVLSASDSADYLVGFFLDEIAKWMLKGKFETNAAVAAPTSDAMDVEPQPAVAPKPAEVSESDDEDEQARAAEYSVALNSWTHGHKRLMELCVNTLGNDFWSAPPSLTASAGGAMSGRIALQNAEAKAQQILQEINNSGTAIIKTGTKDQCTRLSNALATFGASVTLSVVSKKKSATTETSAAKNAFKQEGSTLFWTNGHVSDSLASEAIALLRYLVQAKGSWGDATVTVLKKYANLVFEAHDRLISADSFTWKKLEDQKISRCFAALGVLSGFKESLRVGGKVSVRSQASEDRQLGTVIESSSLSGNKVEIMLDSDLDDIKTAQKVDVKHVRPIPEIAIDAARLIGLTREVLNSLLYVVQPDAPEVAKLPKHNKWLLQELKTRSLDALCNLLQEPSAAEAFIRSTLVDKIPLLIKMAQSADPVAHTLQLEKQIVQLAQRLWDVQTGPALDKYVKTSNMASLLPYYPHAKKADLLPTAFERSKLPGVVFHGDDYRCVEFINAKEAASQAGRRGGGLFGSSYGARPSKSMATEVLILGNALVPSGVTEYYFEVTIETADSSPVISIGYAPEGATSWGAGSCKFQANRVKSYYVNGNRRQEAYGTFYRAKSVVGCGWNQDEKRIFYTKDGEDLGNAFTNIFTTGEKVVPAIGIGKGVRVKINFGQEPFRFDVGASLALDESTKEQRRQEAEERRKKEIEEEEERRRKEKESEDRARRESAEPLMAMGYDMKKALKALEITGYSGPEPAVMWLLENPDYNFDDEPDPDQPAEKKKDEPAKDKDASVPPPPPPPGDAKKDEQMDLEDLFAKSAEDDFDTKASGQYFLGDCYSYDVAVKEEKDDKASNVSSEWEDRIIPELKNFMEKDGFSRLEIGEYLQQIKNHLANNSEADARHIITTILGDAASQIRLTASTKVTGQVGLKSTQVSVGTVVTVIDPQAANDNKEPAAAIARELEALVGRTGIVRAVEHQKGLVLVEFYAAESATLEEWWLPLTALKKPTKLVHRPYGSVTSTDELIASLSLTASKLANVYARRIVITLLQHCELSLNDGPIKIQDALGLSAAEYLSATKVITSTQPLLSSASASTLASRMDSDWPADGMLLVREKLLALRKSLDASGRKELAALLVKTCIDLLDASCKHAATKSIIVSSQNSPASANGAVPVEIPSARAIVVVFDRACYLVPQSKFTLYADEECTDIIKTFPDKSPFLPLAVSTNKFWVKLAAKQNKHNCRFKFAAIPATTDLSLARWIVEFLLDSSLEYQLNLLPKLFDAIVDFAYRLAIPCELKESMLHVLARLIYKLRRRGPEGLNILCGLSLKRLSKLRQEMLSLYETEKKRGGLYSSYFQALIELMVSVKLFEYEVQTAARKEKKKERRAQKGDALSLAIQLAKTFHEEVDAAVAKSSPPKTASPKSPAEDIAGSEDQSEDDEMLKAALAVSMQPKSEDGSEPATGGVDLSELLGQGSFDDDEDLSAAIALSLGQSGESGAAKPEEKMDAEEPSTPAKDDVSSKNEASTTAVDASIDESEGCDESMEEEYVSNLFDSGAIPPPPQSGKKSPVAPPVEVDPQWFTQIVSVAQALESLLQRDENDEYQNEILTELIKKAWVEAQKDSTRERIMLIDGLPTGPIDKLPELVLQLEELFDDVAIIAEGSIFWPVDKEANLTKSYAFVELLSADKFKAALTKVNKYKWKVKVVQGTFTLRATAFSEEETNEANADKVKEYLRSKIYDEDSKQLTTAAREALTEVFCRYSVDHSPEGVLDRERLDMLQLDSAGNKLAEEDYKYITEQYEMKTYTATGQKPPTPRVVEEAESDDDAMDVDGYRKPLAPASRTPRGAKSAARGTEIRGLSLKGLLDLYTLQCVEEPAETWSELSKLGYDLHLHRSFLPHQKDALASILYDPRFGAGHHISIDEDIARYAEQLYGDCELTSPIQLSPAHLAPISQTSHLAQMYPSLARLPLSTLRLRFELLRQINTKLPSVLGLINLGGSGTVAQHVAGSRGIVFHAVKMQFFYDILDKTSVQVAQPTVSIDRLKLAARKEDTDPRELYATEEGQLKNTAFGIAYNQLRHTDPTMFRQKKPPGTEPHFSIKVDFKGEHVEGEGGPYRQFFTDVSKELTKVLPLLLPCPNAQAKVGKNRDKFIAAPSANSRTHLRMYRFVGHLMGMAVRTGVMLNVDFPSFFWKPLVNQSLGIRDLRDIDFSFFGFLKFIRSCDQSSLEGPEKSIFEKFIIPLSDKTEVLLKPSGDKLEVSYSNRDEYLELAEKARLHESALQLREIRRGLGEVLPLPLLELCTWQDLEWRVCGRPTIDIKLLKRHTTYSGIQANASHIKFFWNVLKSFSQEDRRAFVRFAWAQERLPADDQEFERTMTRMLIKPFTGTANPDNTFPKADTCFFNLMLPEYSSAEILRERLLFAIHTDADSMDADERHQEPEPALRGLPSFVFR